MIYMRFPGGKGKALTLSYDDGVGADLRLMKIMKKYHYIHMHILLIK